jgi:hypothetical protein
VRFGEEWFQAWQASVIFGSVGPVSSIDTTKAVNLLVGEQQGAETWNSKAKSQSLPVLRRVSVSPLQNDSLPKGCRL